MRLAPLLFMLSAGLLHGADPGISASEIKIGQAAALSGPAQGLGDGMRTGLKAWVDLTNASGGIHGRKLALVSVDDGYDPDKCAEATDKLINDDQVFCLAGYVGTPTSKVAIPLLSEAKTPLIGAFTGAMLLRVDDKTGKPHRYVFNLRASYNDETETLVARLTSDLGAKRIAVFYQNDSFGLAGLAGSEKALTARSMTVCAKGTFERNTLAVKKGLVDIQAGTPDAVIMIGPYKPIAAFIKEARAAGLTCPLATVSFVGTEKLVAEAGAEGNGVIISQVVPAPEDASIPLVKEYQEALKTSAPQAVPGYISLEGFATGKLLGLALAKAGDPPTREALVDGLSQVTDADLGGLRVVFGANDHQASDAVFLTRIQGGAAVPVTSLK